MHLKSTLITLVLAASAISGSAKEQLVIVNEGSWGMDNGRLSYFEDGTIVSNDWFGEINNEKIGDTPNDIVLINGKQIAIAVNTSNIIHIINPDGTAITAIENVPNCRKLASDGNYLYATSYAHEIEIDGTTKTFTKGYVAKIDVETFKVVAACEVGYEPEGVAVYKGRLFVANSGGYSYSENHDYEKTVSVVNAETMIVERTVDTGKINLYGSMSQSGKYLCINSVGDYGANGPATVIMDCDKVLAGVPDNECSVALPYASTYSTVATDGSFYAIGSQYSMATGGYVYDYITINPEAVLNDGAEAGVSTTLPGTVKENIETFAQPYGLYVNPYSGYIYATDAVSYISAGKLHQWDPQGKYIGEWKVYINPGHFLALPDANGVEDIVAPGSENPDAPVYNLQGIRVSHPVPGQIYIQNGRKFLYVE